MSTTNPTISPPSDTISGGSTLQSAPYRWRWVVLAVVLAADVMDLMDSTIVNVAGPSIRRDLGGGTSTLQWLSAAYTLAFAVLLVTGARLGDIFGRRRLFLIGAAGFTTMSAACAAAPSPALEITFRALQGAFGALMIPQGFGMLKEVIPDSEMPKVFATFGPVMGLSAIAAPILAGVLIDANLWGTGWRLVFLINVPVGLFALITAWRVLPRGASHPGVRLDVPGMLLVGLGLVGIIYPLIQGREDGWPAWIFAMLGAGVALLVAFVAYERRRRESPLIEPSLLRNRTYVAGIAVALALFATFGGLILTISLFAQLGEGFSPIHTGLTYVPMTVGMVIAMVASFALVGKLGRHRRRPDRRRDPDAGADRVRRPPAQHARAHPEPGPDRPRRGRQLRPAVRLRARGRLARRGRVGVRGAERRPATGQRARGRGARHRLLLAVRRRAAANQRAVGHRLGVTGAAGADGPAGLPPADARP
jgi:MFS family permease